MPLRSTAELETTDECLLEKFEECLQRPMPRVTLDSSMRLQSRTHSFLNCLVKIAYKNGFAHELSGKTNIVKTLASSNEIRCRPETAVSVKKAIGAQHKKSVNTNRAIRLAIRESFEFQAFNGVIISCHNRMCILGKDYLRSSDRAIHPQIATHKNEECDAVYKD